MSHDTIQPTDTFIHYLWKVNGHSIEMAGHFTPERWERFCKQPHPFRNDVQIERLS